MEYTCNPRTGKVEAEDPYFQDSVEREESGGKGRNRAVEDGKKKSLKLKKNEWFGIIMLWKIRMPYISKKDTLFLHVGSRHSNHRHPQSCCHRMCRPSVAVWTVLCHQ